MSPPNVKTGSSIVTTVLSTVVVVPCTSKLPEIVTLPVNVGLDTMPYVTVPPETFTSVSLATPAKVTEPPSDILLDVLPSVTENVELASLALAIEPANMALVIPDALTRIVSLLVSIELSSTLIETTPLLYARPSPAMLEVTLNVSALSPLPDPSVAVIPSPPVMSLVVPRWNGVVAPPLLVCLPTKILLLLFAQASSPYASVEGLLELS